MILEAADLSTRSRVSLVLSLALFLGVSAVYASADDPVLGSTALTAGDLLVSVGVNTSLEVYVANTAGGGYTFPDGTRFATGVRLLDFQGTGTDYAYCAQGASCPTVTTTYGGFAASQTNQPQVGGSVVLQTGNVDPSVSTSHVFSTQYAAPYDPQHPTVDRLQVDVTGLNAGATTDLVFYFNTDPGNPNDRTGCFSLTPQGSSASSWTGVTVSSDDNNNGFGQFLEFSTTGTTAATLHENTTCTIAGHSVVSGNVPLSGVFFSVHSSPTLAAVRHVQLSRARHGWTIRWYSPERVVGFNLYDGKMKLNRRLVTSRTHRYAFQVRVRPIHLRIVPVLLSVVRERSASGR